MEERPTLNSESQKSTAAEYREWIANMKLKHELKQKARVQGSVNEIEGEPGVVQPDLSLDFPGMKQYVDWESVVTPATYIVVDQNGLGNFMTVNDAVNSISKDRYRQYRITIQVNAGVYR